MADSQMNTKKAAPFCQVVPNYDVWYSEAGDHKLFLSVVRTPDGSINVVSTLATDAHAAVIEAEKFGKVMVCRRFIDLFSELVAAP